MGSSEEAQRLQATAWRGHSRHSGCAPVEPGPVICLVINHARLAQDARSRLFRGEEENIGQPSEELWILSRPQRTEKRQPGAGQHIALLRCCMVVLPQQVRSRHSRHSGAYLCRLAQQWSPPQAPCRCLHRPGQPTCYMHCLPISACMRAWVARDCRASLAPFTNADCHPCGKLAPARPAAQHSMHPSQRSTQTKCHSVPSPPFTGACGAHSQLRKRPTSVRVPSPTTYVRVYVPLQRGDSMGERRVGACGCAYKPFWPSIARDTTPPSARPLQGCPHALAFQ